MPKKTKTEPDDEKSSSGSSGRNPTPLLLALGVLLFPLSAIFGYVFGLAAIRRKVRRTRMIDWLIAALLAALALVGLHPIRIVTSQFRGWAATWAALIPGISGWVPHSLHVSLLHALYWQMPWSLIVGASIATYWRLTDIRTRAAVAMYEGPEFSVVRPPGILDWVRRRHSTHTITTGKAITRTNRDIIIPGINSGPALAHLIPEPATSDATGTAPAVD